VGRSRNSQSDNPCLAREACLVSRRFILGRRALTLPFGSGHIVLVVFQRLRSPGFLAALAKMCFGAQARSIRNTILIAIIVMTSLAGAFAAPLDNSDPSLAPWFNSLSAPDGTACCAIADCRRTMSRPTADGYEALIDNTWVTVPWDRVLPETRNPTGQAVVCTAPRTKIILCFVRPPDT
jgi:hypothetical protein